MWIENFDYVQKEETSNASPEQEALSVAKEFKVSQIEKTIVDTKDSLAWIEQEMEFGRLSRMNWIDENWDFTVDLGEEFGDGYEFSYS